MMSRPITSFQKKTRGPKRVDIPGTRPSLHNNQLLISTGVPSLDGVLGDGVAVGTVTLVEADVANAFADLILRYFVAEGLTCDQPLFLSSTSPDRILNHIPQPIIYDPETKAKETGNSLNDVTSKDEELKIAWRYKNVKETEDGLRSGLGYGHYFDLTKLVPPSSLDPNLTEVVDLTKELDLADGSGDAKGYRDNFDHTLESCEKFLKQKGFLVASNVEAEKRRVCRVVIHSAGSPLWRSSGSSSAYLDPVALPKFFFRLKSLVRQSFAAAIVTVPTGLLTGRKDFTVVKSIEHLSDYAFKLKSFAGTDDANNPALKDYHGLFAILKLPRLNSLTRFTPPTFDLAFKLRRKRLTIEKLHLPPDMAETQEREQDESLAKKKPKKLAFGGGCGGMTGGSGIDF